MKRRLSMALMLAAILALLAGCAPQSVDPLLKNETTAEPGTTVEVFSATADENSTNVVDATLYFRYLDEPLLAAESRTLTVPRDQSVEYAIVQALVNGPQNADSGLKRLLPEQTRVESVISRDGTLFITLDDGFLDDGVPDDWATNVDWKDEAPLLRKLIVQSIAASVTEYYPYTGVQILVHKHGEVQTSLRLENAYFLGGATGLSDPVTRDESLLLTPQRTAETILAAWQENDPQRLYRYVTDADRPGLAELTEALASAETPTGYVVSAGSVAENGLAATVTATLYLRGTDGGEEIAAYPLQLRRENGVWKMTYERLEAMLDR